MAKPQQLDHYVAGPPSPPHDSHELGQSDGSGLPPHYAQPLDASVPFSQRENPLVRASLLSVLIVHWIQPLVSLGATKALEQADLWPVAPDDSSDVLCARFLREYRPQSLQATAHAAALEQRRPSRSPLVVACVRTFGREIAVVIANFVVFTLALALQAYVAQAILDFLNDRANVFRIDSGYALVAMMAVTSLVTVTSANHGFYVCVRLGVNVRSIAMALVYQKAMRLSASARQAYTTGEIVTLMSVDAERLFNCMSEGFWVVLSPFGFVVTLVLIAWLLGIWAALSGAVLLALVLYGSYDQASRIGQVQAKLLRTVDERVRVTAEALQGIRVLKFYAWEDAVAHRIGAIRAVEVALYRTFHTLQVINVALLVVTPTLLAGIVFGVAIVLRDDAVTVTDAFTLVAIVNVCRPAVGMFPRAIATVAQARVALARIDAFLNSDEFALPMDCDHEVDSSSGTESNSFQLPRGSVSVVNASFQWPHASAAPSDATSTDDATIAIAIDDASSAPSRFALRDISLDIDTGALVMIVGAVGSGKSSLISALLGEIAAASGSVNVQGDVAYVSQAPWIRNASVRANILFDAPFDVERYDHVLAATQLSLDLLALPDGDATEIGERGINLSGGQKARVAIARAMYRAQTDILILDDPLSAVDPHVAHAIFDDCVLRLAAHTTRLVVLNSHYELLVHADTVLVMRDGRIVGNGTYTDVLAQFPALDESRKKHEDESDSDSNTVLDPATALSEPPSESSNAQLGIGDVATKLIQAEDRVKGKVTGRIYKAYFDESGYNGAAVFVVLLGVYIASQGVRTLVDWWQGHWAEAMARDDATASSLEFGMWYLGFIALCCATTVVRGVLLVHACMRCSQTLHNELLACVLRASVTRYFDVTPVGRILNRFANDLDHVDAALPQSYQLTFQNVAMCVGAFAVSAAASFWIVLLYVPMLAAFVTVGRYFRKTSREVKRLEGVSRTPVFSLFSETLAGLATIRAFKMERTFVDRNAQAVDANAAAFFAYWCTGRWLAVRLDLLSVVITTAIALCLVATKGQLSAVVAGLSLTYSLMLTSLVQSTVRYSDRLDSSMTSVERLLHFRSIPREDNDGDGGDSDASLDPSCDEWPTHGAIRFDALWLRYRPELPLVLCGVDMDIRSGEHVGICGRTGAGKSSLLVALFRFCAFECGTIWLDGVDIQRVRLRTLRRRLAIIPQDPVLFSGTLRENLDPFSEYSDDAISRVLAQVHLTATVAAWSSLDFVVAESGENLSVGQRQLLCIARALLKDCKVVVLDEATANVDTATDALIQATITETFAAKTVLIIAHRIHTILHCDKIAVMAAGHVAEFGAPPELLAQPGSIFSSLVKRSSTAFV